LKEAIELAPRPVVLRRSRHVTQPNQVHATTNTTTTSNVTLRSLPLRIRDLTDARWSLGGYLKADHCTLYGTLLGRDF
jgi:hypothetical protein